MPESGRQSSRKEGIALSSDPMKGRCPLLFSKTEKEPLLLRTLHL